MYETETELAKILKVSRSTLWQLRKVGLPYRRVRGQIRYLLDEVDKWLKENGTSDTQLCKNSFRKHKEGE